ncbi:hypothetical protein Enr13x_77320 [Stieleria neptunia]|uniref:Outer membrane lipoprotein-sorting protein n=1 Tax=Stieleria neptunia TaxID=2527979 RepID=A0A518I3Z2_9BACT|nr:hypothetical protein [Stieleria neptunia]QDV47820.1 hypothetical protein Enr13x_77320 [Stieleria neptunia]
MIHRRELLIVPVLAFVMAHAATADENITLQDAVNRFAQARGEVTSYDVSISAQVDDAAEPVRLSNGETYVPTQRLVSFTLDIVSDLNSGRILVARLYRMEDIATGKRENENWQVWMTDARGADADGYGAGRLLSGGTRGSKPEFFDPLALGLGLEGEYGRGTPLAEIAKNFSHWPSWKPKPLGNGVLAFGSINHLYLAFDTQKDWSPVELHSKQGNSTPFEIKLDLSEIDGHWLPAKASVVTGDQRQQLTFNWNSLNRPVGHRFSLDDIANRYQIKAPRRP